MKLFACHTPSHLPLLKDHFLPSVEPEFGRAILDHRNTPKIDQPEEFNVRVRELSAQDECDFGTSGFRQACVDKVHFLREVLAHETEPFVFSDVDVRFYGPVVDDLLKCLGDADMACQWDGPYGGECTGFMVIRPNDRTRALWTMVQDCMHKTGLMDQDALHSVLISHLRHDVAVEILPERYWTFGRNDQHWQPGMPVNPPADMLVHHANWTVGVPNKLRLLDAVKAEHEAYLKNVAASERAPSVAAMADEHGTMRWLRDVKKDETVTITTERTLPYSEVTRMLEDQRRTFTGARHHPLPMALVLQFWEGDKRRAVELARMIADLEPCERDDACFVFARQESCPLDKELYDAQLYVGRKFPVMDLVTKVDPKKKYPGVCFDAWASAVQQLSDAYHTGGLPYGNAFFFESDGCPIGSDWIDRIKAAHTETLLLGKRITGPLMRFGGIDAVHQVGGHINGTLAMHLSCWEDHPSLRRCPPKHAWDVFHGLVLRNEAGPSQIIANHHGGRALSEEMYWEFAKEHAWVTSIKDGTPQHWCRLGMRLEEEKREREARR